MSMKKLLNEYKSNPSMGNARKITRHERKHPMSTLLLTADESCIYRQAVMYVAQGLFFVEAHQNSSLTA